jgi:nicotinamide riboside kinase
MKIGLTGTHSVGKTTLLNALRSEPCFKDFAICDEVTRQIRALGFAINENGNDNTQRVIMLKHIENIMLNDNMITDRTALDCLVYSRYLWKNQRITNDTFSIIHKLFLKLWPQYDLVFFIEPEFDLVSDGVRSIDEDFRNNIHKEFVETIAELKLYKDNLHYLKGSVVNRVNQVLTVYERFQYER